MQNEKLRLVIPADTETLWEAPQGTVGIELQAEQETEIRKSFIQGEVLQSTGKWDSFILNWYNAFPQVLSGQKFYFWSLAGNVLRISITKE